MEEDDSEKKVGEMEDKPEKKVTEMMEDEAEKKVAEMMEDEAEKEVGKMAGNPNNLPRKRFSIEMNPNSPTLVSHRKLLKQSQLNLNDSEFSDSEEEEDDCSHFYIKVRDAEYSSASSAGDVISSAPEDISRREANSGAARMGESCDRGSYRLERAFIDLGNVVAETPPPQPKPYSGKATRQRLPKNVSNKLKEVVILYLKEKGRLTQQLDERVESIVGGRMKLKSLKTFIRRVAKHYFHKQAPPPGIQM
ncbi:hypothetical protein SUGI_0207940 [Cryptomeria japonica]|nr:hypothetical protein SUGI_0207940 [Cryptomeria japonica]